MPIMITHRQYPYTEMEKLLVIGIDVGATLSGVSYALLEPGKVPRIQPVTRFSGKREESGKSTIRSVVCYDQDENVIAAGTKTDPEISLMLSEIEDVKRAECFELPSRPTGLAADRRPQLEKIWPPPEPAESEAESDVPPFIERIVEGRMEGNKGSRGERDGSKEDDPSNTLSREVLKLQPTMTPCPVTDNFRTSTRAFTDLLQYLFESAKDYITETEINLDPTFTWSSIERNTYFVLTHPNRWEGRQQSQLREAAVAAGLVNSSTVERRIAFVAEGKERGDLLVVDICGGTINIRAYSQTDKGGFKEIVSQNCLRQDSILVTSRARDYFNGENEKRSKDSQFVSSDAEFTARTPEGGTSGGKFTVEGAQQREEVAGLVRMLNAQIEQASSVVTDSLPYRESPISSKESDDALNGLEGYIGSSLCNDLRRKSNNLNTGPDPLKTQITLQSGLVNACSYIINNGIPPSDGTTISQAHGDTVVDQGDAATWHRKAQPHAYTTTSLSENLEINRKYLADIALKLITAVGGSLEVLPPQYNEVLEEIVEASLKLHKIVNEDTPVASVMELVTYTIPCDAEFDPSRMEDTEESKTGSGRVTCTMEAGLQYRKRKERGSGEEWHVAVKAKVVLATTLSNVLKGRK